MLDALTHMLGIADFIPQGPVLTPGQRSVRFADAVPSGVTYEGPRRTEAPVLPLQAFGVAYDIDLMLVSDHPEWNMHEYARLRTPEGPVWLMKDAREHTLEQSIVAELDGLQSWMPEVPVVRKWSKVDVEDHSTATQLDVRIAYTNLDDQPVEVTWKGPYPTRMESKRNSSTMGHSRDAVLAVLDLSHKAPATSATIRIDGTPRKLRRLLGLVPMKFALVQTQAGFSIGTWRQEDDATVFRTRHAGEHVQDWAVIPHADHVDIVQAGPIRTLRYRFRRDGDALELLHIRVEQYGRSVPACDIRFSPALPDLRRAFSGEFQGHYVLDVNGQQSHGTGQVIVQSTGRMAKVRIRPSQPRWTCDRPMDADLHFDGAGVDVTVHRI